ncbi:indoleamine 2,3-dioxygenase [uncultured Hyphomonas sp.]|uniref:indoleamine 2,3-dioxygenase n=1 Tax=uncultured Hyphomonas sp. TaxID=225298 RepID=UPI002AAA768C|nr:indoleamine 2,3-dioxygenase [uncultured Hyphomonas sp.]
MLRLSVYGMSRERGFLASFDPGAVQLPPDLQPAREMARSIPQLICTGRVRALLERLPLIDLESFCKTASEAELRIAMLHYSFMVQTYVWGEPEAPRALPACLAVPIWQLGKAIGQPPLLPYSSYTLENWALIDENGPIDLSNVRVLQHFDGGMDEAWFILVHVAIEARAGELLDEALNLIQASSVADPGEAKRCLTAMSTAWGDINAIFDRMPERCDPYCYFHRVRPWIHGWKDNPALGDGLIYEGVEETGGAPQAFRGQTGSQSSIVPAMDALLSVGHAADPLRSFLDELHAYRPPEHRRFIEDIRATSQVRRFIENSGDAVLKKLYNDNVSQLARFRTRHLEYAASYINKQASHSTGNDPDVGTGGTPFMRYLKKHRDEAEAHLLPV